MNATPRDLEPGQATTPANDRLKQSFRAWLWGSLIAATVIHFGVFALWPTLTADVIAVDSAELDILEIPDEIELPEPPAELNQPAFPVVGPADLDEELTIDPTSWDENPVETLPPPPDDERTEALADERFVPFTVPPTIRNERDVVRAMERAYPPALRDAGIGGSVHVLFHIDEEGTVQDFLIDRSSGHAALDQAALSVAEVYRFSPAMNRDRRVAVWVSFPVTFRVRE